MENRSNSIAKESNDQTEAADDENAPLLGRESSSTNIQESPEREGQTMMSPHRALMGLLKSMVGPGCLSLPYGWKQGGLWVSFGSSILISLMNLYCSLQMIHTAQHLCKMYIVNAANIFYQLGVCAIQIVFMSTNLQDIVQVFHNTEIDMRIFATIVLVPVIMVNLIRELKIISILAGIANFILLFGLIIILQECIRLPSQAATVPWSTNFFDSMLFVGTAMYTFEGQAAMLPMENKLRNPAEMTQNCGVLQTTMGFVTTIFIALGFFGFTAYGNNVRGTITQNMPKTPFYQTINMTLVAAAYIGHVVNLYVVIAMLWPGIRRKSRLRWPRLAFYEIHLETAFRVSLVLATYGFAVLVPKIELMIPLIGITAGIMIAFIFPPLFELLTFWESWKVTRSPYYIWWKVISNVLIMSVGTFVMFFGAYQNLYMIYKTIYE